MSDEPFNPAEVGQRLGEALETAEISYALGGALAYGVWAVPRATKDVDINVFLAPEQVDHALDVLAANGVAFDRTRAAQQALADGMFMGWVGSWRIYVFTPSIPFSWEAAKTRVKLEAGWFLSAEALSFFKMMFFRPKDLIDLGELIRVQGKKLDAPYVRKWLVDTMGADDARVTKWDELCAVLSRWRRRRCRLEAARGSRHLAEERVALSVSELELLHRVQRLVEPDLERDELRPLGQRAKSFAANELEDGADLPRRAHHGHGLLEQLPRRGVQRARERVIQQQPARVAEHQTVEHHARTQCSRGANPRGSSVGRLQGPRPAVP